MHAYTRQKFLRGILRLQIFGMQEIAATTGIDRAELGEELETMVDQGLLTKKDSPTSKTNPPYQLYVTFNAEAVKEWTKELFQMPDAQPTVEESKALILRQVYDLYEFTIAELTEEAGSPRAAVEAEILALQAQGLVDFVPQELGEGKTLKLFRVHDSKAQTALFRQLQDLRGKMKTSPQGPANS